MIALLVITDGRRDHIGTTIDAAMEHLDGPITHRLIYDDSGDPRNLAWLAGMFPTFEVWQHPAGRQGFGGAIREAWRALIDTPARFIFHLEDDFTITRRIDLRLMADVLDDHPHLLQLALRRQPWNEQERAAGGIVEQHPDDWHERAEYAGAGDELAVWLESRRNWTTNPSLYRLDQIRRHPWPDCQHSEGIYSLELLARYPDVRPFGYWGARDSGEWCEHTGHTRNGIGY